MQLLISILLRETFGLTLTPVNKSQLVQMAGEILSSFWMLRFYEIVYALKAGINGDYGVVYGHINYQHVANWLKQYSIQSAILISDLRDKNHERATSEDDAIEYLRHIPAEHIMAMGIKADQQPKINRNAMVSEDIRTTLDDGNKLIFFEKHGKKMTLDRLLEWREECKERGWVRSRLAVVAEIKMRIPFEVTAVAQRISNGETGFSKEELQAQANHPLELELALKIIAHEKQKNSQAQNH